MSLDTSSTPCHGCFHDVAHTCMQMDADSLDCIDTAYMKRPSVTARSRSGQYQYHSQARPEVPSLNTITLAYRQRNQDLSCGAVLVTRSRAAFALQLASQRSAHDKSDACSTPSDNQE